MRCLIVLVALAAAGCDMGTDPPPEPPPRPPATFRVTFDATWSAATHPEAFPADPHFSRLAGAVHAVGIVLWSDGTPASNGVRQVAETGGTSGLRAEVERLGRAAEAVEAGPIRPSPGRVTVEVGVSDERPLVTLVSMLAPSPDWFVGVSGLDLRRGDGWADRVVVPLEVYDAGTDDGDSYTAADAPRPMRTPVSPTFYGPLARSTVGTLTFERVGE